jgi:hypothetical protein
MRLAELEIVKKTNYDIQKTVQWTVSTYRLKYLKIGKSHKESTKYHELEKENIILKIDHDKPKKEGT